METTTRQAKYIPDNRIVDADHVIRSQRPGPWACAGDECGMPLTYVKATRRRRAGGGTVDVRPFFRRARNNQHHSDTCSLFGLSAWTIPGPNHNPSRKKIPLNRVFLVTHGEKPVFTTTSSIPKSHSGGGLSPTENYAGKISRLAQLVKKVTLHGETWMKKYFYRHNGVDYTWNDLAYTHNHEEFTRLYDTVKEIVNPNTHRPWVVFGALEGGVHEVSGGKSRCFLLIVSKDSGATPKVRAFFDLTNEFIKTTKTLKHGDPVAVLLSSVELGKTAHGVIGNLISAHDLIVLEPE